MFTGCSKGWKEIFIFSFSRKWNWCNLVIFELVFINSTFWRKKKWRFVFIPLNLEHEFLIGQAVFHFVSEEAILTFAHGMQLSKFCAEKLGNLLLFPLFWGLQMAFSQILTVVNKVRSNEFRKSKCIPISVLRINHRCSKTSNYMSIYISVLSVFLCQKNHQLESCIFTRWRMESVVTFRRSKPFKSH